MAEPHERSPTDFDAGALSCGPDDLSSAIARACERAAAHAAEVDEQARFPREALDALREERLLGLLAAAPATDGEVLKTVASLCFELARGCASTAMIFAMHNVQVACLARHGGDGPWGRALLQRIAAEQLLLAGSTTDLSLGGNARASASGLESSGDGLTLTKEAGVISYGLEADGVLVTTRRSTDAQPTDQVLVALMRSDYRLELTRPWDAMGMRGTRSDGFRLTARLDTAQVLPVPYAAIHEETMLPLGHILWCSVWLGVAAEALDRARRKLRASGAKVSFAGRTLVEAASHLQILRGAVAAALSTLVDADVQQSSLFAAQSRFNLLKTEVSSGALFVALKAMTVIGLDGYRNDAGLSVSRHIRDLCSAQLMIGNERILENTLGGALLVDLNRTLFDATR